MGLDVPASQKSHRSHARPTRKLGGSASAVSADTYSMIQTLSEAFVRLRRML